MYQMFICRCRNLKSSGQKKTGGTNATEKFIINIPTYIIRFKCSYFFPGGLELWSSSLPTEQEIVSSQLASVRFLGLYAL
jgi:hypothetical protein